MNAANATVATPEMCVYLCVCVCVCVHCTHKVKQQMPLWQRKERTKANRLHNTEVRIYIPVPYYIYKLYNTAYT